LRVSRFATGVAAATAGLTLAIPSGAVSSYVIQGDHRIGGYAVKADGTLAGAIDEFGPPSSRRRI
jgi:hypothetical protein